MPLGSRIVSKNRRTEDCDYGYEEPDASTCSRIVIETYRNNGLRVQIEKLVPNRILSDNKLSAGSLVSLKYEDLDVSQFGVVMHVAPCPEIAPNSFTGEGQVVVSRFTSFDVELLVRLDFDGSQSLTGTSIHRIWSLDRQDWVAMGDLEIGERLQGTSGPVTITSTHLVAQTQNVYNIEVQGEHVYEVTELGILVHNTNDLCKQITEIQEALQKDPTNKELIKKHADLKKQLDEAAPKGPATPGGRALSDHAASESLVRHGFKPPFGQIDEIIKQAQWTSRQADGAIVHIHKQAGRGRSYSIVIEGINGTIVTAIKDLSPAELARLASRYGLVLPW